ncbi:MAG: hypothetical protein ACR2PO_04795 [Methyloligellaceae bacterium]
MILVAVPALAFAVLARQVYLQLRHDLSVWKGGGMGMFAGIGAPHHRFLKVFLVDPLGQRIATVRFTQEQLRLAAQVRTEPTDGRFDRLARSLLTTKWKLLRERVSSFQVDSHGRRRNLRQPLSLSIAPAAMRTPRSLEMPGSQAGWQPQKVEIQFWQIGYDVKTKKLYATRRKTFQAARNGGAG